MTTIFCMIHYAMLAGQNTGWNMHLPWLCALIQLTFGTQDHRKLYIVSKIIGK